ncbi:OmpH family outer membrane protein [Spongiimicrobium sp. 2-473A-2-J]|uniref:OmpH family outer membrane protein n=1 Tax=Eudoraea algarum TaxID=3417568 RepID=UPI003D35A2A5
MKKIVLGLALLGLMSCKQDKIAFVDSIKLMEGYQEKVDIDNKFKGKAESFAKKRDSISQAFQIEAQAFQTKAQGMPQKKAQEEYAVLQQKGQFISQQLQQEEQQLQLLNQTELDSLVSKVKKHIREYGKTNGYTYIFGGGDSGSVLYGEGSKDLTEMILKELNDGYKK